MNWNFIKSRMLMRMAILAVCAVFLAASFAAAQWQPRKPVEFVVMAGKGGGAGKLSRLFQAIIQKGNFSNQPFVPVYKSGGSGAEALVYMRQKRRDSHTILLTLNSFFTTPLRQKNLRIDIETFSPIARMALDTFVLWVNVDKNITNLQGWVDAVRAKGKSWNMAGTGKFQEDQLLTDMLEATFNLKMTYTPYKGGGTVAKNLAGNHTDSTVNNPAEQDSWHKAGKTRPLAAFTPTRLAMYPDVPTFKELGYDGMSYYMQRSIIGPPQMPQEAVDYYIGVFRKVHESARWVAHAKKKSLFRDFITGQDLKNYFLSELEKHKVLLKRIGEM
ncbi:MAG: tripartite tricarboxylate transporter substrate-binding protein [bacterium]